MEIVLQPVHDQWRMSHNPTVEDIHILLRLDTIFHVLEGHPDQQRTPPQSSMENTRLVTMFNLWQHQVYLYQGYRVPNYFLSFLLILMIPASNCIFPWCIPLDKNSRNNCFYLQQNLVIGIIFLLINSKLPSRNSPLNVVQLVGWNLFCIVDTAGSNQRILTFCIFETHWLHKIVTV